VDRSNDGNEPRGPHYYVVRAAICRAMAHRATDPASARFHEELARRFDFLAGNPHPVNPVVLRLLQAS
jgi:hypothetical protein